MLPCLVLALGSAMPAAAQPGSTAVSLRLESVVQLAAVAVAVSSDGAGASRVTQSTRPLGDSLSTVLHTEVDGGPAGLGIEVRVLGAPAGHCEVALLTPPAGDGAIRVLLLHWL